MQLRDLIEALEKADQTKVVPHGFNNPHSYRGYYEELAFVPAENVTVASMLAAAKSAIGRTFTGWKGGDFTMGEWSNVYLAKIGNTGEELGPRLLAYMLAEAKDA